MTLRQLVSYLKSQQISHPNINTFGEGDIYDYVDNGGEIVYPVMWCIVKPSTYMTNSMKYRITLLFGDLLTEDKSNRLNIQSEQLLVALDILAKLDNEVNNYFNISKQISIDFFQERFDDFTAGVILDIEITDPRPLSICDIPTIII